MARKRKQREACEERLVQQLRGLQQYIASAGLPSRVCHQGMTQNQGEATKLSPTYQLIQQVGDNKIVLQQLLLVIIVVEVLTGRI